MTRSIARLVLALVALAAVGVSLYLPAGAGASHHPKHKPRSPLPKVISFIGSRGSVIGREKARIAQQRVQLAQRQLSRNLPCDALERLGDAVAATKGVEDPRARGVAEQVGRVIREAQATVYERFVDEDDDCAIDAPSFAVSANTRPVVQRLAGARKLARLDNGKGERTDFVEDELILRTASLAKAASFAKKWDGKVLRSRGKTHLLEVDPSDAPVGGLGEDLRKIDPGARGKFKVSTGSARRLLAIAADAAADGMKIGPNFVAQGTDVLERNTGERPAAGDAFPADAFQISYNRLDGADAMGTGEAWRTLAIAGRLGNRVPLAVVDGGFTDAGDFPAGVSGADNVANPTPCSGGQVCRWHGTNVASAAAGVVDNGQGVAGSGGQIANLILRQAGGDEFSLIDGIYEALDAGAKVINISSGWELDASVSVFNVPVDDATQTARERGALVVASAGNEGRDVDAEDCAIVCWEEEWIAPCENDAVLCVGGLDTNGKRAAGSNYGYEWCASAKLCDVDVFGPWTTWVGPDPDAMSVHQVSGTSFSAPFVSGVAAMMLAANPKLTPAQLETGLIETAKANPDKYVSRVVNAYRAVLWAFQGQHVGPAVVVPRPQPFSIAYGGLNSMHFDAKLYTVGTDPTCCSVRWTVDGGSTPLTGTGFDWVFGTAGEHVVTAIATDGAGGTGSGSATINALNVEPKAVIDAPAHAAHVYRGQPQKFKASGTDPNEPLGLPCSSLQWEVKVGATQAVEHTATGCQPEFTFGTTGSRDVIVRAKDAYGVTDVEQRSIIVDNPPPNSPPLVTIQSPDEGAILQPNQTVTLKASASDPDNAGPVTGTWSVKYNSTTKTIGEGNQRSWKPSDHVPFHCGGQSATLIFSATDPHGTSTDEVAIKVDYPPC